MVYNNRGIAYTKRREFIPALRDYTQAIKLNRDYAEAYCNRGNAYLMKGDSAQAIDDYTQAIKLNPNFAEAYYNRANAYFRKPMFVEALVDYTKAIDLATGRSEIYYRRGLLRLCMGEMSKAKSDLKTATDFGFDISAAFHEAYESIVDFEAAFRVEVPEDIAEMLRRSSR